ncbi:unnamed protein product [Pseudo-nitzschia multistriata]|uniref:Uncharacterized protein n=1 Tax=Pseudo-nitzschia multistriata TaxID=183589 RepID=A0A448YZ27_9STRA|nr:unnamed protein product [Pseudo-nitzschia multistriata]
MNRASFTRRNEKAKKTPSVGRLSFRKINAINLPFGGGSFRSKKIKKGKKPSMIDIFAETTNDQNSQAHAQMSEKAKGTRLAPSSVNPDKEDWGLLYELACQYDRLKLQEIEELKNPDTNAGKQKKEETKTTVPGNKRKSMKKEKSIKNALKGIFGGTNFTANGSFLNEAFFDQYLIESPEFSSVTFDFSNKSGLYRRFNRKDEEQKNISRKFAAALLKHPKAPKITHLHMSNALLPDAFLEALSDECLGSTSGGLPMLQVLNLESNVLRKDGIDALAKCIADPKVWPRLQVLKLENQKKDITYEAEEVLGSAILESSSLVVIGLHVKGGIPKQQIENTIASNVDKLRQARRKHASKTGTLKARKRNDMEQFFDTIASNTDPSIVEVDLTGDLKFLGLKAAERTKTGASFKTNTTVTKVKMVKLKLDDDFAEAFGDALATNTTLETVVLDSNSFSGKGMKALLKGLGTNTSIGNFQVRHQSKTLPSSDEEIIPELLSENKTVIKLGIDVRNPLIKTKLDRKTNENRDHQRKLRVAARKQKK